MKKIFLSFISIAIISLPTTADEKKAPSAQKIEFSAQGTPPGTMKFAKPELKIKAGQPIELTFKNPDVLQHNLLILKPGTTAKVGALADAMLTDPQAMKKGYVPKSDDILYSTKLVNPGSKEILNVTIDKPGNYPIICTFPGHWRLMSAVLKVEK